VLFVNFYLLVSVTEPPLSFAQQMHSSWSWNVILKYIKASDQYLALILILCIEVFRAILTFNKGYFPVQH